MQDRPKLATVRRADGAVSYGLVRDGGIVDLRGHAAQWPTLREAIAGGALAKLVEAGASRQADCALADVALLPPVPAPEKIICIGVNYPDRNEEYKDGQAAPKYPSMFIRFPRSFVGHGAPLVL